MIWLTNDCSVACPKWRLSEKVAHYIVFHVDAGLVAVGFLYIVGVLFAVSIFFLSHPFGGGQFGAAGHYTCQTVIVSLVGRH